MEVWCAINDFGGQCAITYPISMRSGDYGFM